jgi:hypothetical protein
MAARRRGGVRCSGPPPIPRPPRLPTVPAPGTGGSHGVTHFHTGEDGWSDAGGEREQARTPEGSAHTPSGAAAGKRTGRTPRKDEATRGVDLEQQRRGRCGVLGRLACPQMDTQNGHRIQSRILYVEKRGGRGGFGRLILCIITIVRKRNQMCPFGQTNKQFWCSQRWLIREWVGMRGGLPNGWGEGYPILWQSAVSVQRERRWREWVSSALFPGCGSPGGQHMTEGTGICC